MSFPKTGIPVLSLMGIYLQFWMSLVAQADFVMSLTQDGSVGAFTVQSGGASSIPIFLLQTNGENRLRTQGLFSSGATLAYSAGGGNSGNASIRSVALAPHWTNTSLNYTGFDNSVGNQFAVLEGLITRPAQPPVTPGINTQSVLLGSVTFSAGSVGNVTNLNLSLDQNVSKINLLFNNSTGDEVTPITFVGGSLQTISAVPEPSSMVLAAIGFGYFVRMVRSGRKTTAKNSPSRTPPAL